MRVFRCFLFWLILCSQAGFAFYNNRNMPQTEFRVFTTTHFKVIYQAGLDSLAYRAATVGEAAFPGICRDLHVRDVGLPIIQVVLTDFDDESNGFSDMLGPVIELFAYPMLMLTTGDLSWIDRVMVHELTHQITYFAVRGPLGLYGSIYHMFFLPTWFVEGIAQFEAESWDKNREFLLKSAYNKMLFLDRDHLYGHMGSDYIQSRLLYEEGHSLYRFLVQNHGQDIGGRLLKKLSLFHPSLDYAFRATLGVNEPTILFNWRLMLERDYPISGSGTRPGNYAQDVTGVLKNRFAQFYSLKRCGEGMVFTGIERTDVFEKNLYAWFPATGLTKLDGPDAGTFFTLLPDGKHVCYSRNKRDLRTGAIQQALQISDFSGHTHELGIKGEEPCALPDGGILFLRRRQCVTSLYLSDTAGASPRRIVLPDSIIQAFRPLYAFGRIFISVIDVTGERKAASLLPDGSDFKIEAEQKGVDIRFPSMNADGQLVFASNVDGPFNLYTKDSSGSFHSLTGDPYGVFTPDFDGSTDSILVTALRDDMENFNLSVFSISLSDPKQGDSWNLDALWKKASGVQDSLFADEINQSEWSERASYPYLAFQHVRPVLIYPYLFTSQNLELKADASDPLKKHELSAGVMKNISLLAPAGTSLPGFEFNYVNHTLYPDISVSGSRYGVLTQYSLSDGSTFLEQEVHQQVQGLLTFPLNVPSSGNAIHAIRVGLLYSQDETSYPEFKAGPYKGPVEIPLSVSWSMGQVTPFVGNYTHPLDAFSVALGFSLARSDWAGEADYSRINLAYRQSIELFKSYQTIFLKLKAVSLLDETPYTLGVDAESCPRGINAADLRSVSRYLSATGEYRLPIVRDVGLSALGLHFQMFSLAPFVDGLVYDRPGILLPDAGTDGSGFLTAGMTGRQQLFFMGKFVVDMNFHFYYTVYHAGQKGDYGVYYGITGESGF